MVKTGERWQEGKRTVKSQMKRPPIKPRKDCDGETALLGDLGMKSDFGNFTRYFFSATRLQPSFRKKKGRTDRKMNESKTVQRLADGSV